VRYKVWLAWLNHIAPNAAMLGMGVAEPIAVVLK
jgi:hypothetical protein